MLMIQLQAVWIFVKPEWEVPHRLITQPLHNSRTLASQQPQSQRPVETNFSLCWALKLNAIKLLGNATEWEKEQFIFFVVRLSLYPCCELWKIGEAAQTQSSCLNSTMSSAVSSQCITELHTIVTNT